jgi:uncharacterized membrane protein
MKRSETALLSLVCYLIPVLGPLYLLVQKRDSRFARVHAQQMLALVVSLVVLLAGWVVVSWVVAWIPLAGPLVAAMLSALAITGLMMGAVLWLIGLLEALRGSETALPVIWNVSRRLFASGG